MKRILMISCIAAAMFAGLSSCEEPETGYEGINYIYLESDASYLYDMEGETLDVTVRLTTALEQDLTLTFKTDDTENLITLEGNPVTITAGATTATFTIVPGALSVESKSYKVSLDQEATVLPENVQWAEDFTFTVNSSVTAPLTDEQQAIIDAYKESTGIDLSKYIGLVKVSTVYTASNPDSEIPNEPVTLTGITAITLSEKSTSDQPVLKMTANPMGLQDVLYEKLKDLTVENPLWTDPNAYQSFSQLMTAINWNSNSQETFSMSLDDIRLGEGGTVSFVADNSYYDEDYEEDIEMFIVPFEFEFSAYDRELVALENGQIGTAVDEYWDESATANPAYHLNCDNIKTDEYEPGYNESTDEYYSINWVESTASISAEKLEFTFCLYNYNDYDYSKVVATYTPNE